MDTLIDQIPLALERAQAAFVAGQPLRAIQYVSTAIELAAANVAHFDYDMEKLIDAALPGCDTDWRTIILDELQRTFLLLSVYGENTATLYGFAELGQSFTGDVELQPKLIELIYTARSTGTMLGIMACGATHCRQKLMALMRYYESHHAKQHLTQLQRLAVAVDEGPARTLDEYTELVGYELALIALAYLRKPSTITAEVAYMSASIILNFVRVKVDALKVMSTRAEQVGGDCLVDYEYDSSYELLAPIIVDDTTATFYCISPIADTTWWGNALVTGERAMTDYYGNKARTILMTPPDPSTRVLQ